MVDEFELFKARSYTGGTDTAAALLAVTSSARRTLSNYDDEEPQPSSERCPTADDTDADTCSHRRHSTAGSPLNKSVTRDGTVADNMHSGHHHQHTSFVTRRQDRRSSCFAHYLDVTAVPEIWNSPRPRSGSWQGGQTTTHLTTEFRESHLPERRRVSTPSSDTLSPTGSGSGSRNNSNGGNSPQSCSPKNQRHRQQVTQGSPRRRRVSPSTASVVSTSPTVPVAVLLTSASAGTEQLVSQRRSTIICLSASPTSPNNSSSVLNSRRPRSSSPRRCSSPASHIAGSIATSGGRRNSAITYLTEKPAPSTVSFLLQTSSTASALKRQNECSHQPPQQQQGRRSSLRTEMPLLSDPSTGEQLPRLPADQEKENHIEENKSFVGDAGQQRYTQIADGLCYSPSVGNGDKICRIAVYGGQQAGKTTLVDQLLTSEYLANQKDDNITAREDSGQLKSVLILLDGVECLIEFSECGRVVTEQSEQFDISIVVYSVTDLRSFEFARMTLDQLKDCCVNRHGIGVVTLVANKNDLVRNRVVTTADGKKLMARCPLTNANVVRQFIEVSALLDHKVDQVLIDAVRAYRRLRAAALKRRRSSPRQSTSCNVGDRHHSFSSSSALATNDCFEGLDNLSVTSDSGSKGCIQRAACAVLCGFSK